MGRVYGRCFSFAAGMSMAFCAAACLLWVRSLEGRDTYLRTTLDREGLAYRHTVLTSDAGVLAFVRLAARAPDTDDGRARYALQVARMDHGTRWMLRQDHAPRPTAGPLTAQLGFAFQRGPDRLQPVGFGSVDVLHVSVPHWCLIGLTAALPAGWLWRQRRAVRRRAAGLCPGCGYDVRASPTRTGRAGVALADGRRRPY